MAVLTPAKARYLDSHMARVEAEAGLWSGTTEKEAGAVDSEGATYKYPGKPLCLKINSMHYVNQAREKFSPCWYNPSVFKQGREVDRPQN